MQPDADSKKSHEQAHDVRSGIAAGLLAAVVVFALTYALLAAGSHGWELARGLLSATSLSAAFGWIAYCFPWLIDVVAFLAEVLVAVLG